MNYDPMTKKYPFPDDTSAHYLVVKKNDGTVFDSAYPYIDRSRKMIAKQSFTRFLLHIFAFHIARIRLGLRVEGRENLEKHREVIEKGVISCCNHVHLWDFIAVMYGVRNYKPYVLTWPVNVRGENGKLMRAVRSILIPDTGVSAVNAMNKTVKEMIDSGGWLHIYPEGSMWEYYMPIRPFRDGAAYFARACGKPVLPMAFSYRKPGWIRRNVFGQIALFTLHIGEPVYADETLPRCEQKNDLTRRVHEAICRLAGIDPEKNVYPPVYDHSKRIDYYG